MKIIRTYFLLLTTTLAANPASADQMDSKLETLFLNLKLNTDLRRSQELTNEIWRIWSSHKNNEINILFRQGESAMYKKEFESALLSFNRVIELAPNFAEGWNKRATIYYLMGDYHASLADIEKTLKLEPRHFGALSGQGQCYFELQKYQPALNAFEKALKINPWLYDVHRNIDLIKRLLDQQT